MTEFYDSFEWGKRKRLKNFYGENKWEFVKAHNEKLSAVGDIIANSKIHRGFQ